MRLLLVEDNDDTARALKSGLEQLGYIVALAHNGPVALNVARTFDPDVVLMDIGLPVMDGWELAKRLRALRSATQDAPVVAVTAYDRDVDKQRSSEAGFAEHLVKPIDLAKLQEVVESLPLRTPTWMPVAQSSMRFPCTTARSTFPSAIPRVPVHVGESEIVLPAILIPSGERANPWSLPSLSGFRVRLRGSPPSASMA